jgi:hypothetical protein
MTGQVRTICDQHEMLRDSDRTGYIQSGTAGRQIADRAIDRAAIELNRSALQDAMAWERALVVHDGVIRQNLRESTKRGSAELKFV